MATVYWRGAAQKKAQVVTFAFAGTWEADDLIRASFSNGKSYDFTAGSTVNATVVSTLVTNWNALDETDFPEFAEITASANSTTFTLTMDEDGVPFTVTLTPLDANGGAADAQTIEGAGTATTGTTATANSGPNDWSVAANWSGGAVPVDSDDVIIENSEVDILYGFSQSSIDLTSLRIMASFTGKLGLPRYNDSGGYFEYRDTALSLGTVTTGTIGQGEGRGSPLVRLNVGSNQTSFTVYKTGASVEGDMPAVVIVGTHNSNVIEVLDGDVGIAVFAGQTATVATLQVGGGTVWCGSGVTLTTLKQQGGTVTLEAGLTTVTKTDGELTINAGAVTTLTNYAGTVFYRSSGTVTTLNLSGRIDFTQDLTARTVTTTNLFSGAEVIDTFATVTWSNGLVLTRCRVEDVTLDLGYHRTLTPS